jgi:hypothetical protein
MTLAIRNPKSLPANQSQTNNEKSMMGHIITAALFLIKTPFFLNLEHRPTFAQADTIQHVISASSELLLEHLWLKRKCVCLVMMFCGDD